MKSLLKFIPAAPSQSVSEGVFDPGVISKDMDVFFRNESSFIPEGKTINDLTDEEKKKLKSQYRFDPMRPGEYQGMTGNEKMV